MKWPSSATVRSASFFLFPACPCLPKGASQKRGGARQGGFLAPCSEQPVRSLPLSSAFFRVKILSRAKKPCPAFTIPTHRGSACPSRLPFMSRCDVNGPPWRMSRAAGPRPVKPQASFPPHPRFTSYAPATTHSNFNPCQSAQSAVSSPAPPFHQLRTSNAGHIVPPAFRNPNSAWSLRAVAGIRPPPLACRSPAISPATHQQRPPSLPIRVNLRNLPNLQFHPPRPGSAFQLCTVFTHPATTSTTHHDQTRNSGR